MHIDDDDVFEGAIAKIDDEQRVIFGWAFVSKKAGEANYKLDTQDDFWTEDEVEKSVYDYMLNSRQGDDMHMEVAKSEIVESMVFTPEKIEKMGLDPDTTPLGWWVGFKVHDDDVWKMVKEGKRTMFSIGGKGKREKVSVDA